MNYKLLKGLSETEEEDVKSSFTTSNLFRKRLMQILEDDKEAIVHSMVQDSTFNSSNWAFLQAERVAELRVIERVKGYLDDRSENLVTEKT